MKFINVKNLISYLFFLISPFLGLVSSFLNIALSKNRKCFYLILSAFAALFFVKRPPLNDLYRYYLHFSEIENLSDVGLKDGYYLFDLIFGILIPGTTKNNIMSNSIIKSYKCKYVHKNYPVSSSFSTKLLTILIDSYTFIF